MPVGLLGLEWPVDSDPLIPLRGGGTKRAGEGRMMDRSRDLGSCQTSIKINTRSEENLQTHRGGWEKRGTIRLYMILPIL